MTVTFPPLRSEAEATGTTNTLSPSHDHKPQARHAHNKPETQPRGTIPQ